MMVTTMVTKVTEMTNILTKVTELTMVTGRNHTLCVSAHGEFLNLKKPGLGPS